MGVFHVGHRDGGIGDTVVDDCVYRDCDGVPGQDLKAAETYEVILARRHQGRESRSTAISFAHFHSTIMDAASARNKIDYLLGWHA